MRTKPTITIGTVLVAVGLTVVLTISVLAMLPSLVRTDRVQARLVETIKAVTGRTLTIRGKVTVSLFPAVSVLVTDVALSNPPGFSGPDLVRAGALSAEVKLLPLLSGRAEFAGFEVIDPAVVLETDRQGRCNWIFRPLSAGLRRAVRLGEVHVRNGRITWLDQRTGSAETAQAVDLVLHLDGTLSAQGSLSWHGRPVAVSVDLDQPWELTTATGSTPVRLSLENDLAHLAFAGRAEGGGDTLDGQLDLTAPSLARLDAWLAGARNDPPAAADPLAIRATATAGDNSLTLRGATVTLGDVTAHGDLALSTSDPRPTITGRLALDHLDLGPWLARAVDFPSLRNADADLTVQLGAITAGKVRAGPGTLTLALRDGILTADSSDLALYGGTAKGRLTLNRQAGSGPSVDARLALSDVQAGPLLSESAGFDRLDGTMTAGLHLAGRGTTPQDLLTSLAGDGSATFRAGTIRGIDLAALVRNSGGGTGGDTPFSELSASWSIAGGIVTTGTLALRAPDLRLDGSASVDLPHRTLAARLVPAGMAKTVPVAVNGSWDQLSSVPDTTKAVSPPRRPGGRRAGGGAGR